MVVCNLFVLERLVVVAVVLSPAVTLDWHPGIALWPRILQHMYMYVWYNGQARGFNATTTFNIHVILK